MQVVGAVFVDAAAVKPGAVGTKRPALGRLLLEHVVQVRLEDPGVDSGAPNHRSGGRRPRLWAVGRRLLLLLLLERHAIDPRALWMKRDAHRVCTRGAAGGERDACCSLWRRIVEWVMANSQNGWKKSPGCRSESILFFLSSKPHTQSQP